MAHRGWAPDHGAVVVGVVFLLLKELLQPALGPFWGSLVAFLYGIGAGILLKTMSQVWACRWEVEGFRRTSGSWRMSGTFWLKALALGVPVLAIWILVQWAGLPASALWYAGGFGVLCLMLSWENAARGLVPRLQDARDQALRSKLAPHFIFNTLNTLKAQITTDPAAAEAMTDRLAQLFRQVLEVSDDATIPLKQELAFVEAYLGIEQARLGERLKVVVEVPEDLEALPIPPLSLQVLVENAIKHGVAPLEQGGTVRIGAERREGALYLWVEDPGTGASRNKGTGTALETLRQRLEKPGDLEMGMVDGWHRVGFRWRRTA
jgi:hypothetical protein